MSELRAWLRLVATPEVGNVAARKLLMAFGSPQAIFDAPAAAIERVAGRIAAALGREPDGFEDAAERCERWCDADPATHHWISLGDDRYPAALLQIADPPPLLFAQGDTRWLQAPTIAIVGSRNASAQGVENAKAFAKDLSGRGFTIVSGLAHGIDTAAHEGALLGGGSTIAVVGTGLDRVYPKQNLALARRIAERGLLISELPIGTPPLPPNFPLRNRIIAGLARGTLVVEAAAQSGSLITARLASESGREVFAIPGSIHSPQSRGCHALIKQGAKLVETAQDILGELPASPVPAPSPAEDEPAEAGGADGLLQALGHDPVTLDALAARTGWPAHQLSAQLLELELAGLVERLPGGIYQRVGRA